MGPASARVGDHRSSWKGRRGGQRGKLTGITSDRKWRNMKARKEVVSLLGVGEKGGRKDVRGGKKKERHIDLRGKVGLI